MKRALWLAIGRARAGPPRAAASPTDLDRAMMRRALGLARHAATLGEVPVGAVVYHTESGTLLGEGFNRRETDRSPAAHAEFLAIDAACKARRDWRLTDATLVVTLEPCAMCAGLIVNARVGRVVFAAADPKAGAAGSLFRLTDDPRLNHRVAPIRGLEAERASALLRDFFAALRRARKSR